MINTDSAAARQVKNNQLTIRQLLTVYRGPNLVGSIEEGRSCLVRDADGAVLGLYGTRRDALRAIERTARP
jgi:hypothetical protein